MYMQMNVHQHVFDVHCTLKILKDLQHMTSNVIIICFFFYSDEPKKSSIKSRLGGGGSGGGARAASSRQRQRTSDSDDDDRVTSRHVSLVALMTMTTYDNKSATLSDVSLRYDDSLLGW